MRLLLRHDPGTLRNLLGFIYSGEAENTSDEIEELLYAADKYEMTSLVTICEEKMKEVLSTENVLNIWKSAERHNMKNLKKFVAQKINTENISAKY